MLKIAQKRIQKNATNHLAICGIRDRINLDYECLMLVFIQGGLAPPLLFGGFPVSDSDSVSVSFDYVLVNPAGYVDASALGLKRYLLESLFIHQRIGALGKFDFMYSGMRFLFRRESRAGRGYWYVYLHLSGSRYRWYYSPDGCYWSWNHIKCFLANRISESQVLTSEVPF